MADRRRSRTRRDRRHWIRARAKDSGGTENGADASLRAFVRALARQAARECFVRLRQGYGETRASTQQQDDQR